MTLVFNFIEGVADVFLSVMLWFIFDKINSPDVIIDGKNVYFVKNVLKPNEDRTSLNLD